MKLLAKKVVKTAAIWRGTLASSRYVTVYLKKYPNALKMRDKLWSEPAFESLDEGEQAEVMKRVATNIALLNRYRSHKDAMIDQFMPKQEQVQEMFT